MRLIKDWTASEKINSLSFGAETFFTRLIMKADDFGCYYGNPKLLAGLLYPLKTEVNGEIISEWISECVDNNLFLYYESEGKKYIKIINFGQRLRSMQSKFPQPAGVCGELQQSAADRGELPPEEEVEVETEEKKKKNTNLKVTRPKAADFKDLVLPYDSAAFSASWLVLITEPKWRNKSKNALQMALKKLSNYPEAEAIQMMENTIAGGWQGIFEINKNNGINKTNSYHQRKSAVTEVGKAADLILARIASENSEGSDI